MTRFVLDVTGTCGPCCKANIQAWIEMDKTMESGFTLIHVTLSPNYKKLIVHIKEDDKALEGAVQDYLVDALKDSTYRVTPKQVATVLLPTPPHFTIFGRWLYAALGLGVGIVLLTLSLVVGTVSFPVTLATALCSVILTLVLGFESLRKAKTDFYQLKPGMDSLFALSALTALGVSIAGLFIPGLPMMFDVGLLIFGFRHLGIALKDTMNTTFAAQAHYQRLVSDKSFKKSVDQGYEHVAYKSLQPGDIVHISAGEMIPLDGWLLPPPPECRWDDYELDVSIPQGSTHPKRCARDERVLAGMVANAPCVMCVGFGKRIVYGVPQQPEDFFEELHVYVEAGQIKITSYSDKDSTKMTLALSRHDLTDIDGNDYSETLLRGLSNKSMHHLELPARQQLLRAIAQRANELGLTQTSSFLQKVDEQLAEASLTSTPLQDRFDKHLKIFVPCMISIAIGTGLVLSWFFPVMIALQCAITILVSACPCTFGLVIPLVMEFARNRARTEGIIINDSAAIERLHEVDVLVCDLHKTLTQGNVVVEIEPPNSEEINSYLALLERGSSHFIGKAIYAKIDGDRFSGDITEETTYAEGVSARINGERYYLGNSRLMARFNVFLAPGAIYLVKEGCSRPLASIKVYDPLRPDAALAMQKSEQFGFKLRKIATGSDQVTALSYQTGLKLTAQDIHSELSGAEDPLKATKVGLIQQLQGQDHRVLMVGDGINDNAALKVASVSMLMSYPEDQDSLQFKDVDIRILHGQGMISVLKAKEIADCAMYSAYQNLWLSLIYNLVAVSSSTILLVGFGIVLHPGVGAALMVIQICLIIANAYRLSQQPLQSSKILEQDRLFSKPEPPPPVENAELIPSYSPI
jgi:Cu2+-exporting ATPase